MQAAKSSPISRFVIAGAGGNSGQALADYILAQNDNNRIFMTTRTPNHHCAELMHHNADRVTYADNMDLYHRKDLKQLRDGVEEFSQGMRYAVIMPIGHFLDDHKPYIHTSIKESDDLMRSNFQVPDRIMKTLIPHMLQTQNGGHFLGFSCQSVKHNHPFMLNFTAAKAALSSLMKGLANEHGSHGLQFNALAVSSLGTPSTKHMKPRGDIDNYLSMEDLAAHAYDTVTNSVRSRENGATIDAYYHSAVSFSRQGWADRIENPRNEGYLNRFIHWKPKGGTAFPFERAFKPS